MIPGREKLHLPSLATIGVGAFISIICFLGLIITLAPPLMELMRRMMVMGGEPNDTLSPAVLRGILVWLFCCGAFITFGGWRLRVGRSMGLSVVTAMVLLVPCCTSSCFVITIPLGLWILVLLFDREVRDTFA